MSKYQGFKLFLMGMIASLLIVLVIQSREVTAQYGGTEVEIVNTRDLARAIASQLDGLSVYVYDGSIDVSGSVEIDGTVEVEGSVDCH